jgi:hypothetical protein
MLKAVATVSVTEQTNGESESGEDEKGKKTEQGQGMAGLRPGKKRGTSWGEGAAAASLRFGRAPSFFCKCLIYLFFL